MNSKPALPITETTPKISVEAARSLLELALEEEQKDSGEEDPEVARKRAINAYTGASAHLPPAVIPRKVSAN